ncbi:MAG: phosphoglycerate mutase [Anaeromyxobacter sp. RBG_16_69_14]|nr:MAG: phosphoglycerate mutase [Anaeromyxobacter sp. RBG_16_69_14]
MGGRFPDIWLVRHGETEWSRAGRHTGRTDVPLTEEGERQAKALGAYLEGRPFALVLTSPLRRARETCRLAGYGEEARATEDLMEWDYGAREGRQTSEIREEEPGWTIWTGRVPGGETAEQVAARTRRVLASAEQSAGDALLFAHGHVLRILAASWLGLQPEAGRLLALEAGSTSVLGHEHEARVIRLWNRLPNRK